MHNRKALLDNPAWQILLLCIILYTKEKRQMKIVVTSNGRDLDAPASPMFGRCPVYVFVDTDTMQFEAVDNPAMSAAGGAGIQAAQFVVEQTARLRLFRKATTLRTWSV
jgi:hypothetical protein